jgi:hypothetical protein
MIIKTKLSTAWQPCGIYIQTEVLQTRWQDYAEQQKYVFLAFNYTYENLFYKARVSFNEGGQRKEAEDHNEEFKKIFQERMRTSKYFATDGSK